MKIYIIKRCDGSMLGKDSQWTDGTSAGQLFCTPHRDIALNQLLELNAKDIQLRAHVFECEADRKGRPALLLEKEAANNNQYNAA